MEAWQIELASDAANVVLGWVLGIASALGVEAWKTRGSTASMKAGIRIEFAETAYRLVMLVHKQAERNGTLNRDTLTWVRDQARRYQGPNPREGILKGAELLLGQDDRKLAALAEDLKARSAPAQVIPREHAPFATSMVATLRDADVSYARRVLDVLAHLRMFNEAIDSSEYYLRLTFTPDLSEVSHQGAVDNLNAAYEQAAHRARIIVDKINEMETGA